MKSGGSGSGGWKHVGPRSFVSGTNGRLSNSSALEAITDVLGYESVGRDTGSEIPLEATDLQLKYIDELIRRIPDESKPILIRDLPISEFNIPSDEIAKTIFEANRIGKILITQSDNGPSIKAK
jgi:hypothetical protein